MRKENVIDLKQIKENVEEMKLNLFINSPNVSLSELMTVDEFKRNDQWRVCMDRFKFNEFFGFHETEYDQECYNKIAKAYYRVDSRKWITNGVLYLLKTDELKELALSKTLDEVEEVVAIDEFNTSHQSTIGALEQLCFKSQDLTSTTAFERLCDDNSSFLVRLSEPLNDVEKQELMRIEDVITKQWIGYTDRRSKKKRKWIIGDGWATLKKVYLFMFGLKVNKKKFNTE